ncbi:type IV pilin [Halobacteriales archaeon QS_6_64_34]|nr:MAG: type IV pilin [Halobacteriales archaeon QS_6_64_34]
MVGKPFIRDETGVSPVIGVILMVAITVILAAVAGSFILGLGDTTGAMPPQVSINCNIADDGITHEGGDDLTASELRINNPDGSNIDPLSGGPFTAGDTIAEDGGTNDIPDVSGDEKLIWTNPDGDSTQIIAEC